MNPADDRAFTAPLIKALRTHVDAFAASMAGPNPRHGDLEAVRPCAVAWVYYSALVAWAEDHGLIDPYLRPAATAEEYARLRPAQAAIVNLGTPAAAAPAQAELFPPSEETA